MEQNNSKRIAKNTLILYFRMLLIMCVSLYTVRVVFNTLGVVDYGIYNVVGGVITMFAFLSTTMAAASQRFFAFELGLKDYEQLKKTFSMTMTIYMVIAVIILFLAETVGLWFLNTHMTIPPDRMEAANWVYQFSILSFMMTMFAIPYNASIIAHEHMKIYAYVSILDAILKLLIVYLLSQFDFDKLKLYAILIFIVISISTSTYRIYCKRKFEECRYSFYWDKSLFSKLVGFSGWNLFGALSFVFKNNGINILLNMFFSPAMNAARGIAYQINNVINQFANSFITAVNPQITKYYAVGEKENMFNLVFRSTKYSYFLLFIISMPILLETNFILSLWLKNLPPYVELFTQLVIINILIDSLSQFLITSALATGKIKKYQIIVGSITILNLPISYVLLKLGMPPQSTMYLGILLSFLNLLVRLYMLNEMIQLSVGKFLKEVVLNVLIVSVVAYLAPMYLKNKLDSGIASFLLVIIVGLLTSFISVYYIGFTKEDRIYVDHLIRNKLGKKTLG